MATVLYWYDEEPPHATHEVRFSAVETESHEDLVTITEHPVESGGTTTDHAKDEPERVTIEGLVSTVLTIGEIGTIQTENFASQPVQQQGPSRPEPLNIPAPPMDRSVTGLVGAAVGALRGAARPITVNVPTYVMGSRQIPIQVTQRIISGDKPREVYEVILEAKRKKSMWVIATRFREYFDMMLERVNLIRTPDDGLSGRFQLDFRRIHITETETVEAPVPAEARGAVARNKGAQATKPVETPPQLRSTLHRALF